MYTTQDCPKCLDLITLNQTACYWSWCNFSKAVPTIRNYMTSSSPIVISVSRHKKYDLCSRRTVSWSESGGCG
ncbi:predicted protein [Botrytis cinerea T4]|uniref:Uncharacterized protein n=1 Tax=Botryotinia fuckeliana (strain T4) TaxID=999810 RepID=G2XZ94_BOTF4|nr:predicted protein [Botrytis cinerea T4]